MRTRNTIYVNVPPPPKKTSLQIRVERLIQKAEKQHYDFSDTDLMVFEALGREEWIEKRIAYPVLYYFEGLYRKFYPRRIR